MWGTVYQKSRTCGTGQQRNPRSRAPRGKYGRRAGSKPISDATAELANVPPTDSSREKYLRSVLGSMPRTPSVRAICSSGIP
jgi:hypothetical protein